MTTYASLCALCETVFDANAICKFGVSSAAPRFRGETKGEVVNLTGEEKGGEIVKNWSGASGHCGT